MDKVITSPPYTIPLPLTGERDVSFWRYGVRCFIRTCLLLFLTHPRISFPQAIHASGMLSIMYDVVARISILNNGLALPTASGELEL